ncbi:PA2779 family protein [Noviherbaspirillum aridicola]|nr:PA2779 family protein [Noviherbaspirillum aridicola]
MMPKLKRSTASLVTLALMLGGLAQPAGAAIVTTEQLVAAPSSAAGRARIAELLERPQVAQRLSALGVDADDARARVAALSDEEASALAAHLDSAPAGGDFFATLGLIVVLLVVTDLLGVTDIFPFINSVR